MSNKIGIYKITSPTGRIYIGQSRRLHKRELAYKNVHKSLKKQIKIYNSIQKHGSHTHIFEIKEYCLLEDLNCRERFWQDYYDVIGENGLNCTLTVCGDKVQEYPKEFGEAISKRVSGKNNPMYGKQSAMKGKHHREESKRQISEKQMGELNHGVKIVIHRETGIFYYGCREAAEAYGIPYAKLKQILSGKTKRNLTSLYYA